MASPSTAVDTCLLSSITKKMSSSRAKVRQDFCPLKGSKSPYFRLLSCDINRLRVEHSPGLSTSAHISEIHAASWVNVLRSVFDPGGLCLLPASMKPWQADWLACKWDKNLRAFSSDKQSPASPLASRGTMTLTIFFGVYLHVSK